ncbi:MAG: cytochrome c [Blastocatellia bacterium]|nr:cytochrome c [Blastocatellia bacterium]
MNPKARKFALAVFSTATLFAAGALSSYAPSAWAFQDAKALYMQKCAVCHSPDGSGTTAKGKEMKLRDIRSAEVQKQTDAQLTDIIGKGKGKMPGYKSLGEDKVKTLVAYMRELAKKK